MTPESLSGQAREQISNESSMQQFMAAQIEVLQQLFGENEQKCVDWLNDKTEHGEHLRELLTSCYSEDQHTFQESCVSGVVDTLRKDIEETEILLH